MRRKLVQILSNLEHNQLSQKLQDRFYNQVISTRTSTRTSKCANDFDSIGLNLLHWAVLCNQSIDEINRLITTEKINVNEGTQYRPGIALFNVTPFHLAVQTDNIRLAESLLKLGADQQIKRQYMHELTGPMSGNNYDIAGDIEETTAAFAARKGMRTFRLFEKQMVVQYSSNRKQDKREFMSFLPSCIVSLFHFSRTHKLEAAAAYELLLQDEQKEQKEQKENSQDWLLKLKNLKQSHPAINQGKLGEIYRASINARCKKM
jgi:hypothetical protein